MSGTFLSLHRTIVRASLTVVMTAACCVAGGLSLGHSSTGLAPEVPPAPPGHYTGTMGLVGGGWKFSFALSFQSIKPESATPYGSVRSGGWEEPSPGGDKGGQTLRAPGRADKVTWVASGVKAEIVGAKNAYTPASFAAAFHLNNQVGAAAEFETERTEFLIVDNPRVSLDEGLVSIPRVAGAPPEIDPDPSHNLSTKAPEPNVVGVVTFNVFKLTAKRGRATVLDVGKTGEVLKLGFNETVSQLSAGTMSVRVGPSCDRGQGIDNGPTSCGRVTVGAYTGGPGWMIPPFVVDQNHRLHRATEFTIPNTPIHDSVPAVSWNFQWRNM